MEDRGGAFEDQMDYEMMFNEGDRYNSGEFELDDYNAEVLAAPWGMNGVVGFDSTALVVPILIDTSLDLSGFWSDTSNCHDEGSGDNYEDKGPEGHNEGGDSDTDNPFGFFEPKLHVETPPRDRSGAEMMFYEGLVQIARLKELRSGDQLFALRQHCIEAGFLIKKERRGKKNQKKSVSTEAELPCLLCPQEANQTFNKKSADDHLSNIHMPPRYQCTRCLKFWRQKKQINAHKCDNESDKIWEKRVEDMYQWESMKSFYQISRVILHEMAFPQYNYDSVFYNGPIGCVVISRRSHTSTTTKTRRTISFRKQEKMSNRSTSAGRPSTSSTQSSSVITDSLDSIHEEENEMLSIDPVFAPPAAHSVRRLLVVDGCNIARSSCGFTRDNVNCAGLMAVIRWLLVRKFEVVAFLPIIYKNNENFNATNVYLLQKLEDLGVLTFTPARMARRDRRAFINYDDLYVANLAARHGGTVLSGDRFKDILAQTQYNELHEVLRDRRIDVNFHLLKHPYAQIGEDRFIDRIPELFLRPERRFNGGGSGDLRISKRLWAEIEDPDYQRVVLRRKSWSKAQSDRMIAKIDLLMDELCERAAVRPIQLPPPLSQWIQDGMGNGRRKGTTNDDTNQSSSSSLKPASSSSRYSEDCTVISRNEDLTTTSSTQQQEQNGKLTTEDGYSHVVPGLWIPPNLRHLPVVGDQDSRSVLMAENLSISHCSSLASSTSAPVEGLLPSSISASPIRPSWKEVDLLTLNVADLHYCLNHPKDDLLALPSSHPQLENSSNEDFVLAQLVDVFPVYIVEKVLKGNVSRNMEVLANLCAELVT